jgi:hypothetical protein
MGDAAHRDEFEAFGPDIGKSLGAGSATETKNPA